MNQNFKEFFYESPDTNIEEKNTFKNLLATGLIGASTIVGGMAAPKGLINKPPIESIVDINSINWDKAIKSLSDLETASVKKINGKYYGDRKNGVYKAYGPLQMWQIIVNDVNRIAGTNYRHSDAHDFNKAKTMCYLYLKHYIKYVQSKLDRPLTLKDVGMMWNGGPNGYNSTNPETIDYGERFQNMMLANKEGLITKNT